MKTKKCKNCNNCKRLYSKLSIRFFRSHHLYCIIQGKITKAENECKDWQKNEREYDISCERFKKAEEDVKFLLKYFD